MANKAYKYRIYPNKEQDVLIQKTFGCVRFVYNHFLEDRITAYTDNKESRTFFQQNKMLTVLRAENEWLKEPDKNALQYALRDLNTAYQNFFRRVKQGKGVGFPKFKSKKNDRKSYATANNGNIIRIENGKVHLPNLGYVKAKISREIPKEQRSRQGMHHHRRWGQRELRKLLSLKHWTSSEQQTADFQLFMIWEILLHIATMKAGQIWLSVTI